MSRWRASAARAMAPVPWGRAGRQAAADSGEGRRQAARMSSCSSYVDLRSDTVTLPSPRVRAAAQGARVGDDVYGEDPTVRLLEQRVAGLLGKESALFLPTATMANLVAISANVPQRGAAILCAHDSHIRCYEQEGVSSLLGLPLRPMPHSEHHPGEMSLQALTSSLSTAEDIHVACIGAVTVENTHAESGGRALSVEYSEAVGALCKEHGVKLHIDGARLANAATAIAQAKYDLSVQQVLLQLSKFADTATLCLSKGLGAPMGAVLVGSDQTMHRARRSRKMVGGGMRQVGLMAGAALEALEENLERLADDHALALQFAKGLADMPGIQVLPYDDDSTNMVLFDFLDGAAAAEKFISKMLDYNIKLGWGYKVGQLRAVFHRDISAQDTARTLDIMRKELSR